MGRNFHLFLSACFSVALFVNGSLTASAQDGYSNTVTLHEPAPSQFLNMVEGGSLYFSATALNQDPYLDIYGYIDVTIGSLRFYSEAIKVPVGVPTTIDLSLLISPAILEECVHNEIAISIQGEIDPSQFANTAHILPCSLASTSTPVSIPGAIISLEVCGPNNDHYQRSSFPTGIVESAIAGWSDNTIIFTYQAIDGYHIEGPTSNFLTDFNTPCVTPVPVPTVTPIPAVLPTPTQSLTTIPAVLPTPVSSNHRAPVEAHPGTVGESVSTDNTLLVPADLPIVVNISPDIYRIGSNYIDLSSNVIFVAGTPIPMNSFPVIDGAGGTYYNDPGLGPLTIVGMDLFGYGVTMPIMVIENAGLIISSPTNQDLSRLAVSFFLGTASGAPMPAYATTVVGENNTVMVGDLSTGDYLMVIHMEDEGEDDIRVFVRIVAADKVTVLPNTGTGSISAGITSTGMMLPTVLAAVTICGIFAAARYKGAHRAVRIR